jgi:uncharacterized protein with HEPN domain
LRDYKVYLKEILAAVESIEAFVQGMSFEEFRADDKTTRAVIRKFEIIGEATKQIPDSIRRQYPDIPWKDMAGMRDRLIHFYFGVDYHLVWAAIKERLSRLKEEMQKVLKDPA